MTSVMSRTGISKVPSALSGSASCIFLRSIATPAAFAAFSISFDGDRAEELVVFADRARERELERVDLLGEGLHLLLVLVRLRDRDRLLVVDAVDGAVVAGTARPRGMR